MTKNEISRSTLTSVGVFLLAVSALFLWRFMAASGGTAEFVAFVGTLVIGASVVVAARV